jgi:hypothetical protein
LFSIIDEKNLLPIGRSSGLFRHTWKSKFFENFPFLPASIIDTGAGMRDIQQAQQGGVFQSVPSQSVTIDTGEGLFAQGGKEIHISVCWVENHVGSS